MSRVAPLTLTCLAILTVFFAAASAAAQSVKPDVNGGGGGGGGTWVGTVVGVTSSGSPSSYGGPVTFTVGIAPATCGPNAYATIYDNGASIGTVTFDSWGDGSLTTSSLDGGTNTITASFSGNIVGTTTCLAETSPPITQLVDPSTSTFDPLYKIASILYAPPGNQSNQGYTSTTTNGTTSTVSNTFTGSVEYSFSGGFLDGILGPGGGASWGYATGTTNTNQFTQQWITAQGVSTFANKSQTYNQSGSDALNPLLDTFEIWLNPQVEVTADGGQSIPTYDVYSQPMTVNGQTVHQADVLPIVAETMQAQPGGVTNLNPSGAANVSAVPVNYLVPVAVPQESQVNVFMPGMGAICASNYAYQVTLQQDNSSGVASDGECTQANQCGCQPSDFANIMQQDLLLGYNTSNYTTSPENGTVSPLAYDSVGTSSGPGSGASVCGEDQAAGYQIPTNSNCRYVIVPQQGTNTPINIPVNGTDTYTYNKTDQYAQSFTTTATNSYNVGVALSDGFLTGTMKVQDTFTWTDSEGIGTSTGGANTMGVTLGSSNANCSEQVSLYEDTIYHTFLFQVPTGNTGCQ